MPIDVSSRKQESLDSSGLEDGTTPPSSEDGDVEMGSPPERTPSPSRGNRRPTLLETGGRHASLLTRNSTHQLTRTASVVDLQTGAPVTKNTLVEEVPTSCQDAMNPLDRRFGMLTARWSQGNVKADDDTATAAVPAEKQYRLASQRVRSRGNLWQRITGAGPDDEDEGLDMGFNGFEGLVNKYLRWTFRTTFTRLLISSAIAFWLIVAIFAFIIDGLGHAQPHCISVGGIPYNSPGIAPFKDAYHLSWTTLSTVGYGVVFPHPSKRECLGINFFMAFEAFTGVLFAGFISAILFGKIVRSQSFAPVVFSDPILVRYGTGVMDDVDDDDDDDQSLMANPSNATQQKIPCPVLEFRVANRMHSTGRGELMNCNINVVASTLVTSETTSPLLKESLAYAPVVHGKKNNKKQPATTTTTKPHRAAGKIVTGVAGSVTGTAGHVIGTMTKGAKQLPGKITKNLGGIEEGRSYDPDDSECTTGSGRGDEGVAATSIIEAAKQQQVVDEGSQLVPPRVFTHLEVETPAHPFFKRVWFIRHQLDQNSPLLSDKAKALIAENNGYWPPELNSHEAVRENLHFHEIIVNLSGTANATGNAVYATKVYSFCDVNVGYNFVNTLYRDEEGRLSVDIGLLNDVVEQNGGGGEPFCDVCNTDFLDEVAGQARDTAAAAAGHVTQATRNVADFAGNAVTATVDAADDIFHSTPRDVKCGLSDDVETSAPSSPMGSPLSDAKKWS